MFAALRSGLPTCMIGSAVAFGFMEQRRSQTGGVEVPSGRENRELSFDISLGVNFGRRGGR